MIEERKFIIRLKTLKGNFGYATHPDSKSLLTTKLDEAYSMPYNVAQELSHVVQNKTLPFLPGVIVDLCFTTGEPLPSEYDYLVELKPETNMIQ